MTLLRRRVLSVLLAAAPLLATAQPGPDIVTLDDPAEAFARVERYILYAQDIATEQASVKTDSAFTSELVGRWRLGPQNRADIAMAGIFYDFNLNSEPRLVSDGTRMVGGRDESVRFDTTTAPHLRDALAIGFMRMGMLHNLVRLHTGTPPDHMEGGVEEWVTVHGFSWLPETRLGNRHARPMTFTIRVSGQDVGHATLWLDTVTGLPLRRTQVVDFASSQMHVEEHYWAWTILPRLDGSAFKTIPDGDDPESVFEQPVDGSEPSGDEGLMDDEDGN